MGLEIVELFMRAEEEFEIEIGDEEASLCATAGQLCRLIALKLGVEPIFESAAQGCRSSAAFYRTRRDLIARTGFARHEIRPKTPLSQLFAPASRRQMWWQMQRQSALGLPELELSKSLQSGAICAGLGASAFGIFELRAFEPLGFVGLFGGAICLFLLASDSPFARQFPASCATAGDLSRHMTFSRPETTEANKRDSLWLKVQNLIADELSLPLEKVTPDADFVRDFRIG